MPELPVTCPGCGREYSVPREYAGKPLRCKVCKTLYDAPDPARGQFRCPFCQATLPPRKRWRASMVGQIIAILLFLSIAGIPFFWVGLLFGQWEHSCRGCGIRLG